eukprot:2802297-Pleurochrysis_carterae.AAC.1
MAVCACAKERWVHWRAWLAPAWAASQTRRSRPPCPTLAGGCVCHRCDLRGPAQTAPGKAASSG